MIVIIAKRPSVPEAYGKAAEALRTLGESVYSDAMLDDWRNLL